LRAAVQVGVGAVVGVGLSGCVDKFELLIELGAHVSLH
jgi:hypothetical protein